MIEILKAFDEKEQAVKNVRSAVTVLTSVQTKRFDKIYKTFLEDLERSCGAETALFCIAALGKHRISHLNQYERASLLNYLKKEKLQLDLAELRELVKRYKIPFHSMAHMSPHVSFI